MKMYEEAEGERVQETDETKEKAFRRVWSHESQIYRVEEWTQNEINQVLYKTDGKELVCVTRGVKCNRKRALMESDEEEFDEQNEQLVCSMTGQKREALPFSIVIDFGACVSVMPSDWCNYVSSLRAPQADAGEYFRAANGKKIFNEGQKFVSMMTKEGVMRDMRFTVCAVTKVLRSVSQMCKAGIRWCSIFFGTQKVLI